MFVKASSVKALNAFGQVAGPAIGAAVEVGQTGFKIAKQKKERDCGQMPTSAYKQAVTKDVTRAAHAITGGIIGSVVGEIIVPIPILGGIAGGIVGGLIGEAIGSANGAILGRTVGMIDSAVKCNKISKEEARKRLESGEQLNSQQPARYFIYRPSMEGTSNFINEISDLSDIRKAVDQNEVQVYDAQIAPN